MKIFHALHDVLGFCVFVSMLFAYLCRRVLRDDRDRHWVGCLIVSLRVLGIKHILLGACFRIGFLFSILVFCFMFSLISFSPVCVAVCYAALHRLEI